MIAAKKGAEGDCCNIGTIPPSKGSIAYFRNGRHYGQSARVPVKRGSNVLKGWLARAGSGLKGVRVSSWTNRTVPQSSKGTWLCVTAASAGKKKVSKQLVRTPCVVMRDKAQAATWPQSHFFTISKRGCGCINKNVKISSEWCAY